MALHRDVRVRCASPRVGQRFVRCVGAQFCYCEVITSVANGIRVITRLGPVQRCPILRRGLLVPLQLECELACMHLASQHHVSRRCAGVGCRPAAISEQQEQEQRPCHGLTSCVGSRVGCGSGFPLPPNSQSPRSWIASSSS